MLSHGLSQCDIRLGTHRPTKQPKLLMKLDGKSMKAQKQKLKTSRLDSIYGPNQETAKHYLSVIKTTNESKENRHWCGVFFFRQQLAHLFFLIPVQFREVILCYLLTDAHMHTHITQYVPSSSSSPPPTHFQTRQLDLND